ncbi:MAG: hypothetical protein HY710_05320 [Candidatus Latescibacteria bacterium]|nr:hypothetical protein [Candidatus Latescibacterota bacterium]
MKPMYRYRWYQHIYESIPKIHEEARQYGKQLGIEKLKADIGLYPGSSSRPGNLPGYVLDEIVNANRGGRTLPVRVVEDDIRDVVKDVYGDEYDAAVANTCEAAIRICMEALCTPPAMRHGDIYRARFLMLYGEDPEWIGGYGRAFPPKYKNLLVDRTVAGGELGIEGKSLANLEALYVRFAGARYESHGIRFNPTPLLTRIDVDHTMENVRKAAARHASLLAAVTAIGYDTPSYGHAQKDEHGTPVLMRRLGDVAREYDVPFIVDTGGSIPFIGMDPRHVGADIITYSMDKPGRAPACGLIIGKDEIINPVRKGMGLGGQRYGEVSSHGKAVFTFSDPGRDTLVGLLAYLRVLRDRPQLVKDPIDRFHEIIVEEFQSFTPGRFRDKFIFTKTYQLGGTELNYEQTWDDGGFGIPLFTLEDLWANTNPIVSAQVEMGVEPATIYGGKMFLGPGLGTLDEDGNLIEEYARLGAKTLVKAVEIVCKHAGLG